MEISGYCEERFDSVKKAFEKNFNEGKECGASFSVTIEGKTVINLWGGMQMLQKRNHGKKIR